MSHEAPMGATPNSRSIPPRDILWTLAEQPQELIAACLVHLDDHHLSQLASCVSRDTDGAGPRSGALLGALAHVCAMRLRAPRATGATWTKPTPRPWPSQGDAAWLPLFHRRTTLQRHVQNLHAHKITSEYLPDGPTVPLANTALLLALDTLNQAAPNQQSAYGLRFETVGQREARREAGELALLAADYFVPWAQQLPIEQLVTGAALAYMEASYDADALFAQALVGMSQPRAATVTPSRKLYGAARAYVSEPKQGLTLLKDSALLLDSPSLFQRYVEKLDEAFDPPFSSLRETSKELGWAAMQGHVNVLGEVFSRRRSAWRDDCFISAMSLQLEALLQQPLPSSKTTHVPPIDALHDAQRLLADQAIHEMV